MRDINVKRRINISLWSFICALLLFVTACSKEEKAEITKADVTEYSPIEGGNHTILTLKGHNFGTDIMNVRVTINGKDLKVNEVSNETIVAEVQKGTSSGLVRVILGERPNAQVLIYDVPFSYISNQVVSTYLGGNESGESDGTFATATLSKPRFLIWGQDNALYIIEDGGKSEDDMACIRKAENGKVTTLLKATDSPFVQRMRAIDFSLDGNTMYIANDSNADGSMGFGLMTKSANGFGDLTSLWEQSGITCLKVHPLTGDVFIAYHTGSWIYLYENGEYIPKIQLPDDEGEAASKGNVNGIAFNKTGKIVYFVSRKNHVIYKANYDPSTREFSNIVLLAGTFGITGYADGNGSSAQFNEPCQADVDEDGNLYVADRGNHCIRVITPEGEVSTYAGQNKSGLTNGVASQAEFNNPEGCQFGPDGALYIADYSNHAIRKIEEGTITQ